MSLGRLFDFDDYPRSAGGGWGGSTVAVVGSASSARISASRAAARVNATHRCARFGYMLDPSRWGRGYGTEVATWLAAHAFDRHGIRRIEATCHPDNDASSRVLEKAGLRLQGQMRSHLLARGTWRDSLLWAALDTDPRSNPSAQR